MLLDETFYLVELILAHACEPFPVSHAAQFDIMLRIMGDDLKTPWAAGVADPGMV